MTLGEKNIRAIAYSALGAIPFGIWQKSIAACFFMFVVLIIACGAVIALQHCITRAIQGKPIDE